jgi:D-serine deaminase-like pyridoxal phosphate-dependent protein
MGLAVTVTFAHDHPVFQIDGHLTPDVAAKVAETVVAAVGEERAVVDLDRVAIGSERGARSFFEPLLPLTPDRVVFSCRRLGVRSLLRRWHGREIRVFSTREEAALSLDRRRPLFEVG